MTIIFKQDGIILYIKVFLQEEPIFTLKLLYAYCECTHKF